MDKSVYSRMSHYLLITALVIIFALSTVKLLFPAESYRVQITEQLNAISNTPVEIKGSLEWFLSPLPSLSIDEIYLPELKTSLKDVNLSFSLLNFIFLEASPSRLQINKVITTINNTVRTPVEDVTIYFDEASHQAESFNLLIPVDTSSSNTINKTVFRFNGSIEQPDTNIFNIDGNIVKESEHERIEQPLFNTLGITAKLNIVEQSQSVGFDINLKSKNMTMMTKGHTTIESQTPTIYFEHVKTPNIALSGTSYWSKNEAIFKGDFHSTVVTVPESCFSTDKHLIVQHCYDLALLMMLPGNNHLSIDTLTSLQQTVKTVDFYWQTNDGEISIRDLEAVAFGGKIQLEADYKIAKSRWNFSLNSTHINVEKFLRTLTTEPPLFGTGSAQLTGSGEFNKGHAKSYKISGNLLVNDGKTELFNLEKQLCTQVKGMVVTDSISTPFHKLNLAIDLQNDHLQITHFSTLLDGAEINGQGELSLNKELQLTMIVKVDKQDWSLCKIPRALTSIEWPLTCNKQPGNRGGCNINLKQMGLSALLLAESPETKDKAKQKIRELKENDDVKKALGRFEKWLNN